MIGEGTSVHNKDYRKARNELVMKYKVLFPGLCTIFMEIWNSREGGMANAQDQKDFRNYAKELCDIAQDSLAQHFKTIKHRWGWGELDDADNAAIQQMQNRLSALFVQEMVSILDTGKTRDKKPVDNLSQGALVAKIVSDPSLVEIARTHVQSLFKKAGIRMTKTTMQPAMNSRLNMGGQFEVHVGVAIGRVQERRRHRLAEAKR
jgi:hypothetical protein